MIWEAQLIVEKIAWVTDSTAFLDEELQNCSNVFVVPMVVIVNGKEYEDGIEIQPEELYKMMKEEKVVPTTSQPSVGTFLNLYKKLEQEYDRIIAVHVSSKLSGTATSSRQAADMVSIPVHIFDSLLLSFPMTLIIKKLMSELNQGSSITEAFDSVAKYRDSQEFYVLIGSLDQLHRSGRLSGMQYLLGSMLKLKPIISIENGLLATNAKERTEKRAEARIFDYFRQACSRSNITECTLLYGSSPKQTDKWREAILTIQPDLIVHTYPLGSAIGVHAGAETIGISWFTET
jgi:DegV family protein with EDD domain